MITHRFLMAVPKDRQVRHHGQLLSLSVMLLLTPIAGTGSGAFANDLPLQLGRPDRTTCQAAWEQGTINLALGIVEQGIQDHPRALALHQLRGGHAGHLGKPKPRLNRTRLSWRASPAALDVRWAKWSVLVRSGQVEAVAELQRIAVIDPHNPLLHLRLARELRKLDRLEESFEAYQKAVELGPDMLNWRLALARARFDILDYEGAERDVQFVLDRVPPGSPLHLSARNLLTVFFGSTGRGADLHRS